MQYLRILEIITILRRNISQVVAFSSIKESTAIAPFKATNCSLLALCRHL
jgi:hypothetical protein